MASRFMSRQNILLALLVVTVAASAFAANGRVLANSTPPYAQNTASLGPEAPSKIIGVQVDLQLHNLAQRDALLQAMYTKGSPQYHKWLTAADYAAKFGPTAAESAVVQEYLKAHGLSVTSVHRNNFYVKAQGRVSDVEKAFNVQIHRYSVNGKTLYSNTGNPTVVGAAANYIAAVHGLHQFQMQPHSVRPIDPNTGQNYPEIEVTPRSPSASPSTSVPPSLYYENQCWRAVESHGFATNNSLPASYYNGNRYGANPGSPLGHLAPCGYEPPVLQTAYGLNALYGQGIDGTGQTVVVVDAFGSPTAAADIAVFSSTFSLPNPVFNVYNPDGVPPYNSGWAGETTLDIEWSHSMAPGAGIALVQAIDNFDNNLQSAIQYALDNNLGNVISNSYGGAEDEDDAANMNAWDNLNAEGAMLGVSINFSTGDSGDFRRATGAITVSVPSNSPHASAIGGTSDFVNADYTFKFETGWGTGLTRIAEANGTPDIPFFCAATGAPGKCFYYGGGGGESKFFPKPWYQSGLPGWGRQQPDISMDADPYTGVEIIYSYNRPGHYSLGVIGGTSLSCPLFSGVWALVNQKAGAPAGQAAPLVYSLGPGAIHDVKQSTAYTPTNLTGVLFTGGAPMYENPRAIMNPDNGTLFTSAFYNSASSLRWFGISFGTDSSLIVKDGWDNVTGVGTPNGATFVNDAAANSQP